MKRITLISITLVLCICIPARAEEATTKVQAQKINEEIGRLEGPRDTNMFMVEPTVIDERHYTQGIDIRRRTEDQQIRDRLKQRAGIE